MYGYSSPKQLDASLVRVMICESQLQVFMRQYPRLTREAVLGAMLSAGPLRVNVEQALRQLNAKASAPALA